MARAHFVKKARKDNPACKAGESYWWWQFRFGGKRYSKERPKPSQLTQSEFLSRFLEAQEMIDELNRSPETIYELESICSDLENIKDDLEDLQSETEDKQSNVEDAFPNGSPVIDQLEERAQACSEAVDMIDEVISSLQEVQSQAEGREEENRKTKDDKDAESDKDEEEDEDLEEGDLSSSEKNEAEDAMSSLELECPE